MSGSVPGLQPANGMTAALSRPAAAPAPAESDGPPDMTDRYNTPLSPEDEAKFQAWGAQQAAQTGRNPAQDTFDYDMRGFWKSGDQFAANGHAGDTFKKPNHPTFSSFSKYNGVDGYQGGQWGGGQNGQPWTFTPSQTNLQMNDAGDLQKYFQDVEKGNHLILPQTPAPAASATPAPAVPAMPVPPIPPAVAPPAAVAPAPAPKPAVQPVPVAPSPAPIPVPPAGNAQLLRQLK
jgi:hypothetical protein